MTTTEIGKSLVTLCKTGEFEQAYKTLFADNARSIEAGGETATGLHALLAKGDEWGRKNTVHRITVTGPYVAGDTFAVFFSMNLTPKASGQATDFDEIALYRVADAKIVEERFLYGV